MVSEHIWFTLIKFYTVTFHWSDFVPYCIIMPHWKLETML